jgi:hypothetical protein
MSVRTIRQLPRIGTDDAVLVHKVRATSNRGYNGTDCDTYCGLRLICGVKWAPPEYECVTCVSCLGTRKTCAWCDWPLSRPKFPSDTPERCDECQG